MKASPGAPPNRPSDLLGASQILRSTTSLNNLQRIRAIPFLGSAFIALSERFPAILKVEQCAGNHDGSGDDTPGSGAHEPDPP